LAKEAGIKRLLSRLPYNELLARSKRAKVRAGRQMLDIISKCMAGDESEDLKADILRKFLMPKSYMEKNEKYISLLKNIAKLYLESDSTIERTHVLTLLSIALPYKAVLEYVPDLTIYFYGKSRKLAKRIIRTLPPAIKKERFDPIKVNAFVEFITTPGISISLPYGWRTTKIHGINFEIPNTLR
jgi:hypothetical protein